jgi:DNA-binding NarL/FixJ family response regulator
LDRQQEGTPLRVLIADDHPIVLEGLTSVLARIENAELAGVAINGAQAVKLAEELRPDVLIMDLRMPEMDGVEATRRILQVEPGAKVLVLTMFGDDEMVDAALKAGARGFLLKGCSQEEIERALSTVASGNLVFGTGVADQVVARLTNRRSTDAFPQLTAREREILGLLAEGNGNQQLARKLFISPKTVRNHVANILAKLEAPDRAQAVVMAREAGYGSGGRT